jgi:hypothetical protein
MPRSASYELYEDEKQPLNIDESVNSGSNATRRKTGNPDHDEHDHGKVAAEPRPSLDHVASIDRVRRWIAAKYAGVQANMNGLSPVLLLLFALQAWMQTFPLVAYSGWKYNVLHLSNPELNQYNSLSFVPPPTPLPPCHPPAFIRWCCKSLYVWYLAGVTTV